MKAKSVIAKGELVSDELVIGLIMNNLKRPSCINGAIISKKIKFIVIIKG